MSVSAPSYEWMDAHHPTKRYQQNQTATIRLKDPVEYVPIASKKLFLLFRESRGPGGYTLINSPGMPISDTSPFVRRSSRHITLELTQGLITTVTALLTGDEGLYEGFTFLTGWIDDYNQLGCVIIEKPFPKEDRIVGAGTIHDYSTINNKDINTANANTETDDPKETEWGFKPDWEDTTKTNHTTTTTKDTCASEWEWGGNPEWETTTKQNEPKLSSHKQTSEWDIKPEWEDTTKPPSAQTCSEWMPNQDTWTEHPKPKHNTGLKKPKKPAQRYASKNRDVSSTDLDRRVQSVKAPIGEFLNETSTPSRNDQGLGLDDDDSGSGNGKEWAWTPSDSSQELDGKPSNWGYPKLGPAGW